MITTFPLIPVILTDMNLKAVLVFVLFATELAGDSRGRYVFTDDMTDQVFLVATGLATDTTGQMGTLVHYEREHSVVVSKIYTNNQDIEHSLFQRWDIDICISVYQS